MSVRDLLKNRRLTDAVDNIHATMYPNLKTDYCQSRNLYMLAGALVVIAGAIALGMTSKDLSDVGQKEDEVQPMSVKTRVVLNLLFSICIVLAGVTIIHKGRCVPMA